jgi:ABC-2 type transport system permease protein
MFWKIFVFEVQNRLRRPLVYVYFFATLLFITLSFATGSLPVGEKEHINSPMLIAFTMGWISIFMMLVTSGIMGMPLFKDIEHNTKDYYLTYPITKAGYFWGRYFSSLIFVLIIGSAVMAGVFLGTKLGLLMHWKDASNYGPNNLMYYWQPFLLIAIPNLIFTSSLFYGLVAITRNIKVIYSGGIILFLGYLIASFFLVRTNNQYVITLADPFGFNGIREQKQSATAAMQNTNMIEFGGPLLLNRIVWPGLGIVLLILSYIRFNFEDFFSGKRDKNLVKDGIINRNAVRPKVKTSFAGSYNRKTLLSLTKTELLNIVSDNYFWIIIGCGLIFLGFVFSMGNSFYSIPDFPRTVELLDIFNEVFLFFIFFIIIFYTGETVHRDRITRYAFINDSLPTPNWVLNGSRLLSLLVLGLGLSLVPMLMGIGVQLFKEFTQFNFPIYLLSVFGLILPRFLEMVVFSYVIHVVVNNKFAAHGIGITIWVALYFLHTTSVFNYNLLLYSYTPGYRISDMDGIGHMATPVAWFNVYWLVTAGLLVIVAALFYYRGVSSTFKERLQLAAERFNTQTRLIIVILAVAFLLLSSFIYYNVSYLNSYLTQSENNERAVLYERTLKHFQNLPLPNITSVRLKVDLYPEKLQSTTHGYFTLVNKTQKMISLLLIDGEDMPEYDLKISGKPIPFTIPLVYKQGKFNWFRPKKDTADFRLYQFEKALAPGDSVMVEMHSAIYYNGFSNDLYSADLLHNGTFFKGGLPSIGYDDDDEISSPYERKRYGLPPKKEEVFEQNDPEGVNNLKAGKGACIQKLDITVSTSADQTGIAPGILQKQWVENGRNYFHYIQNNPGMYPPFGILSANYSSLHDVVKLDSGRLVNANVYYNPLHPANVNRYQDAIKDGIKYYSNIYGNFAFNDMASMSTLDTYSENNGWTADFKKNNLFDYCYYTAAMQVSQQWWRFMVAPNNTVGSLVIPEGLARYDAYVMAEKKYGKNNIHDVLQDEMWRYLYFHSRGDEPEHTLLKANESYEYQGKAGNALYGLRDLIGEQNMNAALKEFKEAYAFKKTPPYPGSNDLYHYLKKHTPDSVKYYLADTWEKITFYNNRVIDTKTTNIGNGLYKVTLKVSTGKIYINKKGNDIPAEMNDYIDIGIFSADTRNKEGQNQVNPIYFNKHKLTEGEHTIILVVKGKPEKVGIDPYNKLIDRVPRDNIKAL